MATQRNAPHYPALDGLRGVAAVAVVISHSATLFGVGKHSLLAMPHGYLAVDFFFALSGLVVANAYEARLASGGISVSDFAAIRLIRLVPLMVLAALVAASVRLMLVAAGTPFGDDSPFRLMIDVTFAVVLLPQLVKIHANPSAYPLNGPTWSIFFELAVNALWATIGFRLRLRWLVVVALVSLVALSMRALKIDTIQFGWGRGIDFLTGFPRVIFSFTVGLIFYRIKDILSRFPVVRSEILLIVLLFVLSIPAQSSGIYDIASIILVLPLILAFGIHARTTGRFNLVTKFLGEVSFALYAIHYPLLHLGFKAADAAGVRNPAIIWLPIFVLAAIAVALFSHRFVDVPLRTRLTRIYNYRKRLRANRLEVAGLPN